MTETNGDLHRLADQAGVDHDLAEEIIASGRKAVHGNTWVVSIATLSAPWSGMPTNFMDALRWVATAQGSRRGWALRFTDGSELSCTRRYNSSARGLFSHRVERPLDEPPLKVRIGNKTLGQAYRVLPQL